MIPILHEHRLGLARLIRKDDKWNSAGGGQRILTCTLVQVKLRRIPSSLFFDLVPDFACRIGKKEISQCSDMDEAGDKAFVE